MTTQTPPFFRVDQIGSLLRPQKLLDARAQVANAAPADLEAAEENLRHVQKEAINDVVQDQLDQGVRPITDGEFARNYFYDNFFDNLTGFELHYDEPIQNFRAYFPTVTSWIERGNKTRPARLHPGYAYDTSVYANDAEYFADVTAAYRAEIRTLYDAGLRNIQIDDPNLTFFGVESFREGLKAEGIDAYDLLNLYISVHNDILRDIPPDLNTGIHLCRGNAPNSTYYASTSYTAIAPIFQSLSYRTFYLEFDTPRAGPFAPLAHLPRTAVAVLGLVTTKGPELESAAELVARVHEAAAVIAEGQGRGREEVLKECLAVSPQCGFSSASWAGGIGVTEEVMWAKLGLVREVARLVWGERVA